MRKLSTEILSYIAGFLDADGSISISRRISGTIQVYWCNCNEEVIDWIVFQLDTKAKIRIDRERKQRIFRTYTAGKRASEILTLLLPYLHVKKRKAEICIEYEKTHLEARSCPPSEADKIRREQLINEFHSLKNNSKFEEIID